MGGSLCRSRRNACNAPEAMSAAGTYAEVKRNLPGWSVARDTPRPAKKQGWECPTPTVQDWEDYKKWKEEQEKKDELPAATQIFLADSSLLFYQDPDVELPWIHRLKCELPRRLGRLSGDLPVKASYIGFGTNDEPDFYELFKQAMAQIGVVLCRQIHNPPNRFELAHLEQSDVILVGGGDRKRLWETLGTDLGGNAVAEHVRWRYLSGAVVIAVGEAMSLLGEKSWYTQGNGKTVVPYTGWKLFPHIVAPDMQDDDLEELVEQLGGAGVVILGVYAGGGMIFNSDGLVEPARHMVQEYRWDWKTSSVKRALLMGPPRSTGLICPLYAAMKRDQDQGEDDTQADVWAFALTTDEEHEEEQLFEQFDPHSTWLTPEAHADVERLKAQGNEAFKTGKADLAGLNYEQAMVLLKSSARRRGELEEEVRRQLDELDAPKQRPGRQLLPSEKRQQAAKKDLGCKEDYRASNLLSALLLNVCACHLLAHEQDQGKEDSRAKANSGEDNDKSSAVDGSVSTEAATSTVLVEVRDNLVAAFRAANQALSLSGGRSAKAWYRRGCVFERMRDPRNAVRDFEEALLRAPGDKAISVRRDIAQEAASKVAENMYYARHKELDAQEQRVKVEVRNCFALRGSFGDSYDDQRHEFAVAQPLARLVDGTLEEVDGSLHLTPAGPQATRADAPYFHPHALWTWETLVQRGGGLQLLQLEDVDLGSGPLEWVCKGLRSHSEIRTLRFTGTHIGSAGAKMLRNVLAQSVSLTEVALDGCALHDAGLAEIAEGLRENSGPLEALSLRRNYFTARRIGKLAEALCQNRDDGALSSLNLTALDLSENPLGVAGAKEIARVIGSEEHRLRTICLKDCLMDVAAFWRLVGNLNDARPLSQLDLRCNPIGAGTRRIWKATMGPTIRCEVMMSERPMKALKERQQQDEEDSTSGFPLPRRWV
eukprot:gnl/TRDRNA2_/TRDRNA2_35973_c0_seq1.p1 gnl/TRDRNA2_/TRDRNA2_35973_c0~~gnl/TRDRNA2_/TRDRNA2_35973_c0_seq1.p1  ORF type:complete len:938 (+),score=178.09 gnl/TRDRNA2_/TRDRNA2_35973_c0_seq1:65-2878(+)